MTKKYKSSLDERKYRKMKRNILFSASVILGIILGLFWFYNVNAKPTGNDYTYQPTCQANTNQKLAWTLDSAWLSTNKSGNWETDAWFYMLKPYQPVYVIETDRELGYYLICFQFDPSWQPIYGWVEWNKILLNSDVR
jgi:hypothetical protein